MIFVYYIFIGLILAGNTFGLYKFLTGKEAFIQKFPSVTNNNYFVFQLLPIINSTGLAGMLFFKNWSPWIAVLGAVTVIAVDLYFGVRYHLYIAIPSTFILLFLIYKFYNLFK
jgi:hypothetical protein